MALFLFSFEATEMELLKSETTFHDFVSAGNKIVSGNLPSPLASNDAFLVEWFAPIVQPILSPFLIHSGKQSAPRNLRSETYSWPRLC